MALKKDIVLKNGITLNYHRIAQINNVINGQTLIVVYSYVNQEQREREKNEDYKYPDEIYKVVDVQPHEYDDKLTIKEAYEYLKTTKKYEGAEDIFENDEVLEGE